MESPRRILMLVPHEPELDPRIRWVTQLCAEFGPTDIIASVSSIEMLKSVGRPAREYNGNIYLERINKDAYSSKTAKCLCLLAGSSYVNGVIRRYVRRESLRTAFPNNGVKASDRLPDSQKPFRNKLVTTVRGSFGGNPIRAVLRAIDHKIGAVCRLLSTWSSYNIIISALYRRARAISIIPRVIICHDIFGLAAGVRIKKLYGCPLIYDSHELWPEADLLGQAWHGRLASFVERKLIRQADAVVTVSPQLARYLENIYGISKVYSAPNAEPRGRRIRPSSEGPSSLPIKFLFQGQVARRRGIEQLLNAWNDVKLDKGVLYLRCPENEYFVYLRGTFHEMLDEKRVVILQPVTEAELVSAATFADVGIIPYAGPNLNHVFCCPNKLSQYMQAGLAILSNRLKFISELLDRYQCGLTYDAAHTESFVEAVRYLIHNPEVLQTMKRQAHRAARTEFNWECQSVEYKNAIRERYYGRPEAHAADTSRSRSVS